MKSGSVAKTGNMETIADMRNNFDIFEPKFVNFSEKIFFSLKQQYSTNLEIDVFLIYDTTLPREFHLGWARSTTICFIFEPRFCKQIFWHVITWKSILLTVYNY